MIRSFIFAALVLIMPSGGVAAQTASSSGPSAELSGEIRQGALIVGRTAPGNKVIFDGRALSVTKDGRFVFGFGRNAAATSILRINAPNGEFSEQPLAVSQRTYAVQRIDGLPAKKVTPDPVAIKRIAADNTLIRAVRGRDSARPGFKVKFVWPVVGPVSGVFGSQRILNGKPRSPHNGVDVAAPEGTTIIAPAPGVVTLAHQDMFYTGKTVMIDHGHGVTSVYAHMSEIAVSQGQQVFQGAKIGRIGKTGRVTGPHLHWGVTWFKTHVDPALLTGPMP